MNLPLRSWRGWVGSRFAAGTGAVLAAVLVLPALGAQEPAPFRAAETAAPELSEGPLVPQVYPAPTNPEVLRKLAMPKGPGRMAAKALKGHGTRRAMPVAPAPIAEHTTTRQVAAWNEPVTTTVPSAVASRGVVQPAPAIPTYAAPSAAATTMVTTSPYARGREFSPPVRLNSRALAADGVVEVRRAMPAR